MLMHPSYSIDRNLFSSGITIAGVSKHYGTRHVLSNISIDISPGETLAVLGPNGAGKTTIFKLILGLTKANSGKIRIADENPASETFVQMRRFIGFLPENISFYDMMTGREALKFFASIKSVNSDECEQLLSLVELEEAADYRIRTYSKGMKQRLGLAQALLGSPKLLLLDEPMTGLDPALRQSTYLILERLRNSGVTIVLSSHALHELQDQADRYAILDKGHFSAIGTFDELQDRAGLPTIVRITAPVESLERIPVLLTQWKGQLMTDPQSSNCMEFRCRNSERADLIRALTSHNMVLENIEVKRPDLSQIYIHFTENLGEQEATDCCTLRGRVLDG